MCQVLLTDFRESNQLAARLSSFIDEVDSLLNASLEVEPLRRVSKTNVHELEVDNECDSLLALR